MSDALFMAPAVHLSDLCHPKFRNWPAANCRFLVLVEIVGGLRSVDVGRG